MVCEHAGFAVCQTAALLLSQGKKGVPMLPKYPKKKRSEFELLLVTYQHCIGINGQMSYWNNVSMVIVLLCEHGIETYDMWYWNIVSINGYSAPLWGWSKNVRYILSVYEYHDIPIYAEIVIKSAKEQNAAALVGSALRGFSLVCRRPLL